MTAPAGWQKGSWRGLPFFSLAHVHGGGRRGVQHELAYGETPIWEDLGGRAQSFQIDCHIVGPGYLERASTFARALQQPGAGTLIHPWYGSMQVAAGDWSRTDSTVDGGSSAFSITFLETGLPAAPAPAADTAAQSSTAAQEEQAAAAEQFVKKSDLAKAQEFIEKHTAELVKYAGAALTVASSLQGGIGPGLLAITANLGVLPPGVQAQLREPLALAGTMLTAVQSIRVVASGTIGVANALIGLLGFGDDLPPVIGDTPARAQQRANQAAFVQLINVATAGELAAEIAGLRLSSYDEAVALRDAAAAALDRLALRQADLGDDAGAESFDRLRRAIVRDVTARGGSLQRLRSFTPAATAPALAIAHRLYADPAATIARADEIVARNRIAHPGFVAGGRALQVLTGGADG